jgi:hypothetical protein
MIQAWQGMLIATRNGNDTVEISCSANQISAQMRELFWWMTQRILDEHVDSDWIQF